MASATVPTAALNLTAAMAWSEGEAQAFVQQAMRAPQIPVQEAAECVCALSKFTDEIEAERLATELGKRCSVAELGRLPVSGIAQDRERFNHKKNKSMLAMVEMAGHHYHNDQAGVSASRRRVGQLLLRCVHAGGAHKLPRTYRSGAFSACFLSTNHDQTRLQRFLLEAPDAYLSALRSSGEAAQSVNASEFQAGVLTLSCELAKSQELQSSKGDEKIWGELIQGHLRACQRLSEQTGQHLTLSALGLGQSAWLRSPAASLYGQAVAAAMPAWIEAGVMGWLPKADQGRFELPSALFEAGALCAEAQNAALNNSALERVGEDLTLPALVIAQRCPPELWELRDIKEKSAMQVAVSSVDGNWGTKALNLKIMGKFIGELCGRGADPHLMIEPLMPVEERIRRVARPLALQELISSHIEREQLRLQMKGESFTASEIEQAHEWLRQQRRERAAGSEGGESPAPRNPRARL